jgi:O-antigen ligase
MNIPYNKFSIQKSIDSILILYAFTLPLSRAAVSITSALLFLLWLSDKNRKERFFQALKNPLILSITVFILFCFTSLLWSDNVIRGLLQIKHYWFILPLFVFATHVKQEILPKLISAFLLGMIISEVLSYGIFFELWHFGNATPQNPSPIMNHIHYSTFLVLTSLLLLNRFFFETQLRWRIAYFAYFLLTSSNLFINGGRTGQLAYLLGLFVVGMVNIKHKFLAFLSIFFLAAFVFGAAFSISPNFQTRLNTTLNAIKQIESGTNQMYASSFGTRLGSWMIATKIFQDHPILGVGVGSEMDALKKKIDTKMPELKTFHPEYGPLLYNIKHYHNSFVTYLVEMGVVGLLLFLSIFYSILKLPIKDKELNNLKYIFVTVFMTACFFEQMFALEFPLALFTLFGGIFVAASKQGEK